MLTCNLFAVANFLFVIVVKHLVKQTVLSVAGKLLGREVREAATVMGKKA